MQLNFRYRFEAAHRFTNSSSQSCMTPHGHTWHATLHVQSNRPLDANNMIAEFSQIKSFWKELITEVFDHSYMCHHADPILEGLLAAHGGARLMRFPGDPTTEMIALMLFNKAEVMLATTPQKDAIVLTGVTIEETPTNSIHCPRSYFVENIAKHKNFSGWWTSTDIQDRSFAAEPK